MLSKNTLTLFTVCLAIAVAAGLGACSAEAQNGARTEDAPGVGDKAPNFTMKDYTGKAHTLEDYRGKVVVLDFSSQHCPYSKAADPHFAKLHEEFKDQGVVILSIDSHNATPPEDIAEYAEENELPFPILKDEGNAYADKMAAQRTPEVFILDKEGTIMYHGAFDDGRMPGEGDKTYVKDALTAILAGEDVNPATTKAIGCTIKRAG